MTAITCCSVSKHFGSGTTTVRALSDVNLEIAAGEFVCLLGPSGSGKTTLINAIAGLETPDAGEVFVQGSPMSTLDAGHRARRRLREVGLIFQDGNLINEFSAMENVMLPLLARGYERASARSSARHALTAVGIAELEDRYPSEMSGGQRQRVGVARGLVGDRSVLLADEPTGSLDSTTAMELFRLLAQLAHSGATIVVATHDERALGFADRAVRMADGRLSSDGPSRRAGL